jgi:hypothetical protein
MAGNQGTDRGPKRAAVCRVGEYPRRAATGGTSTTFDLVEAASLGACAFAELSFSVETHLPSCHSLQIILNEDRILR